MNNAEIHVVYRNSYDEVKSYILLVRDETEIHLEAVDLDTGYPKTFRKDRIIEICGSPDIAIERARVEQKKYVQKSRPSEKVTEEHYSKHYNFHEKLEVCFTGFKKPAKIRLNDIAVKNNLFVRKSVSKNLSVLVCGENPGPSKIQAARKNNISIVYGVDGLLNFVRTGEVHE